MKELQESLQREKSSRTDLEMYVAVLNTQKNVLSEDVDKLRLQLNDGEYVGVFSDFIHWKPCILFVSR